MEIALGFILSLCLLLSVGSAILAWFAWQESKKVRPDLAKALRTVASLVDEMAKVAHVDPASTGSASLRAMASEAETGSIVRPKPEPREGPAPTRMRPLTDEEEWALEQARTNYEGLSDADATKARRWVRGVEEGRMALSEG